MANTVSIKRVFENVQRDFMIGPEKVSYEDQAEWIGSLMALVGPRGQLRKRFKMVKVEDGRGNLPRDLHSILQTGYVRMTTTQLGKVPSVFFIENEVVEEDEEYQIDTNDYVVVNGGAPSYTLEPMFYTGDTMSRGLHAGDLDFRTEDAMATYEIEGRYVFTNFEKGYIVFAYFAIPMDDNGWPEIPNVEAWIQVCGYEVARKYLIREGMGGETATNQQWYTEIFAQRKHYLNQAVNLAKIGNRDKRAGQDKWFQNHFRDSLHKNFFRNAHIPNAKRNTFR